MRIERGPEPGPYSDPARYKPHLRPVFRWRCAYCLTPDDRLGGEEGMTVDHFKPQRRFPHLRLSWSNLYYACPVCNSHYKKDRPTPEEEAEGKRLVDACEEDPDDHFRLVTDPDTGDLCRVGALSPAAEYTIFLLKLNRRKFLSDYWRSIQHEELQLLVKEHAIRQGLDDCSQDVEHRGTSEAMDRIRADFQSELEGVLAAIEAVRQLRPFPVA